jgi:hypothetical protein
VSDNLPLIWLGWIGFRAKGILEEREPIPDQDDRDPNIIEHVNSRYGLNAQEVGERSAPELLAIVRELAQRAGLSRHAALKIADDLQSRPYILFGRNPGWWSGLFY